MASVSVEEKRDTEQVIKLRSREYEAWRLKNTQVTYTITGTTGLLAF